ncbi:hypothetical protein [Hoeflea sp.]|uniref:hypothetical protein n=1 Tax=Hoeflea sp. TaxID=1940281 RepID=UPI003BB22293
MSFDLTAIAWYAVICGVLSALAPSFGGRPVRLAIGGLVGIAAATALPMVRGILGL